MLLRARSFDSSEKTSVGNNLETVYYYYSCWSCKCNAISSAMRLAVSPRCQSTPRVLICQAAAEFTELLITSKYSCTNNIKHLLPQMFLRGLRKAHFSCSNRLIKLTKIVLFTPAEKSKYNYIYKIILNFKLKKSSLFSQQIKKLISCFVSLAYFHAMCTKLCKIISSAI